MVGGDEKSTDYGGRRSRDMVGKCKGLWCEDIKDYGGKR